MTRLTFNMTALASCMTLLAAPLCTLANGAHHPLEVEIKAENTRWSDALAKGDYAAIGKLYTDDGTLLPPGEERVVGPAAIAAYFTQKSASSVPRTIRFSNFEFYGDDRLLTEITDTEIHDHNGKLLSRGKQILIFIKQNGAWKLHRDIWNGSPLQKAE